MLRFIFSVILLAVLALWSFHFVKRSQAKTAIGQVCETVASNFFDTTKNLAGWVKTCRAQSLASLKNCKSLDGLCLSSALNQSFASLESSHLFVATPAASRRFYHHEAKANGLKLKWIQGKILIVGSYPGSPAAASGARFGDLVLEAGGEPARSLQQVQESNSVVVDRRGEKITLALETATFQMDHLPELRDLGGGKALLTLSSFEGEFEGKDLYATAAIKELAQKMRGYRGVVVDLRGNLGGNFVALLRALSPFLCEPLSVGTLQKLGQNPEALGEFPDSLEFSDQWPIIAHSDGVLLKTFSDYGCYRGNVALLVDSDTSSVAEIFAHVLREEIAAPILGHPTAGAVLVALREELDMLGPDYYLNMPILTYLDLEGRALEGAGLWPDQQLQYDLGAFRGGRDNWLEEAARSLNL